MTEAQRGDGAGRIEGEARHDSANLLKRLDAEARTKSAAVPKASRVIGKRVDEIDLFAGNAGVFVGATFTGFEVAESLHAATIAVVCELRLEQVAHAVPCFPTRSEVWLKLIESYGL